MTSDNCYQCICQYPCTSDYEALETVFTDYTAVSIEFPHTVFSRVCISLCQCQINHLQLEVQERYVPSAYQKPPGLLEPWNSSGPNPGVLQCNNGAPHCIRVMARSTSTTVTPRPTHSNSRTVNLCAFNSHVHVLSDPLQLQMQPKTSLPLSVIVLKLPSLFFLRSKSRLSKTVPQSSKRRLHIPCSYRLSRNSCGDQDPAHYPKKLVAYNLLGLTSDMLTWPIRNPHVLRWEIGDGSCSFIEPVSKLADFTFPLSVT